MTMADQEKAETRHAHVCAALQDALREVLDGTPCRVLDPADAVLPVGGLCAMAGESTHAEVTPDLAVGCLAGSPWPTLVVEILDAGSLLRDTTCRLAFYEALRIQEYWIVDTRGLLVHAFRLNHENKLKLYQSAAPGERLQSKAMPWVSVPAWEGWLPHED